MRGFPWLPCLQRLGLWGWAGQTLGSLHQLKVVWHQVWGFHSSTFNPEVPPIIIVDPLLKTLTSIKHAQCKPLPLICEESRVPVVDLPVLMCFSCEYQSNCSAGLRVRSELCTWVTSWRLFCWALVVFPLFLPGPTRNVLYDWLEIFLSPIWRFFCGHPVLGWI